MINLSTELRGPCVRMSVPSAKITKLPAAHKARGYAEAFKGAARSPGISHQRKHAQRNALAMRGECASNARRRSWDCAKFTPKTPRCAWNARAAEDIRQYIPNGVGWPITARRLWGTIPLPRGTVALPKATSSRKEQGSNLAPRQ